MDLRPDDTLKGYLQHSHFAGMGRRMKSRTRIVTGIAWLLLGSLQAHAMGSDRLYLGAGVRSYNMGKVTSSDDGSTSMVGELYLPLTLAYRIPMSGSWCLDPSISYTPLAVKTTDSISKTMLTVGLNATHAASQDFSLKSGLGLLVYSVGGPGGSVDRNNGGGTSTFYYPGNSQSSKMIYVDLGLGYQLTPGMKLDLDAAITGALSSRRAVTTTLSISWGVL
ncbi:MAG: hypothetical protein EBX52_01485 [Proteobacteria bacterium]|nr:hypothetical protein [Pseudomonadota bacterium]